MRANRLSRMFWTVALTAGAANSLAGSPATQPTTTRAPENVHVGELVRFPGPWSFQIGRSGAILVSDQQLEDLANPDKPVNLSLSATPREQSLRQICEQAQAAGHRTLILAFDHFFAQYRPGQGDKPRRLTPDKPEYVRLIAAISRFIAPYGLGLELSLLTPLEIGPAYVVETGEHGVWMEYRKGLRDPETGAYSVQLWRQTRWTNNKGSIEIQDAGVRVFAFRERRMRGTPYLLVDPAGIVDISSTAQVEVWPGTRQASHAVRIRVHGTGPAGADGLDRVLVVQMYKTPEMDYFSDRAAPYLRQLLDRYVDAGVRLNALYSDEMHIQQDWGYHSHHQHGQFAMRYVSPGLAQRFASLYGQQYRDFAKYLIYFAYGQQDFAHDLSADEHLMHVFDPSPEGIRAAALLRSRYYRLLQDGVVDLFTQAKHYLEGRVGHRLDARAHATWAESPTCDIWSSGPAGYEYTPAFVWSNTVQQAASACHDYFKWGDFLTGNGNDHAEGGWLDRNYYALSLAASTGILNEVPYSYAAIWGVPGEVARRRHALIDASGAAAGLPCAIVEGMEHRDVQVLRLYPLDLVAAEERFGSWMSQDACANYVTQAGLLERGRVAAGAIEMTGRRFTTLIAEFEPFPSRRLLDMMRQLAGQGGRVIWSGPPPVLDADGKPVLPLWQELFGVNYTPGQSEGVPAAGKQVVFEGMLAQLPPMTVLTDFLVDHIYPLSLREAATAPSPQATPPPAGRIEALARCSGQILGTHRTLPNGGSLTVLGFRPRDDQSASLGYETRCWFDILHRLGAYPPSGRFSGINDNTEYLSRTSPYLVCRFPNGAVALAPHLKDLTEAWPGGFARDPEQDKAIVQKLKLPSDEISLDDFKADGHEVGYQGREVLAFRPGRDGIPVAFCGRQTNQITIDGRTTRWSNQPMPLIAYAPVDPARRIPGGAVMQILVHGSGEVSIPVPGQSPQADLVLQGPRLGSRGQTIPARIADGTLTFTAGPGTANWLYLVPR